MSDIIHLVEVRELPEKVYQALTAAEGIRNWWTQSADFDPRASRAAHLDPIGSWRET